MNDLFLTVLAGFHLLVANPYNCSGTALLQLAVLSWPIFVGLRLSVCALSVRKYMAALRQLDKSELNAIHGLKGLARTGVSLFAANTQGPRIAAVGFLRPKLIVDPEFIAGLSEKEALAVVTHECCHIRKRDALRTVLVCSSATWLLMTIAFSSLLFMTFLAHAFKMDLLVGLTALAGGILILAPLQWLLETAMRLSQEFKCDKAASAVAGGPELASALLKTVRAGKQSRTMPPIAALQFGEAKFIRLRVRRAICGEDRQDTAAVRRMAFFAAALIFIAVLFSKVALLRALESGKPVATCIACNIILSKSNAEFRKQ